MSSLSTTTTVGPGKPPTQTASQYTHWHLFGYFGFAFALIYRIPQIQKIRRTKSAKDISGISFVSHNGAYVCFTIYLIMAKDEVDPLLLIYYLAGFFQNMLIFYYSVKYSSEDTSSERSLNSAEMVGVSVQLAGSSSRIKLNEQDSVLDTLIDHKDTLGIEQFVKSESRESYRKRREWFAHHKGPSPDG